MVILRVLAELLMIIFQLVVMVIILDQLRVMHDAISKYTVKPGSKRYYVPICVDEACVPVVNKRSIQLTPCVRRILE